MAAQADLASEGKVQVIFETGKCGLNCAQRSVLIRTIGPSFYGVQAMMFRSDPLVAHITVTYAPSEHAACQTRTHRSYFAFFASTNSFRRARICNRRLILAFRCRP